MFKYKLFCNNNLSDLDDQDEMVYSPLTCELCSETFTIPAEWVRHIEGHAEATQCVPKKRKRIDIVSINNAAFKNISKLIYRFIFQKNKRNPQHLRT